MAQKNERVANPLQEKTQRVEAYDVRMPAGKGLTPISSFRVIYRVESFR
jgi:hypothetical protein